MAIQLTGVVAILLATFTLTNLIYHMIDKPTELFFFVGHRLDKEPAEDMAAIRSAVPHLFHWHPCIWTAMSPPFSPERAM
jgi:hypothetical protein